MTASRYAHSGPTVVTALKAQCYAFESSTDATYSEPMESLADCFDVRQTVSDRYCNANIIILSCVSMDIYSHAGRFHRVS